jgi:hypothetical protein
MGDSTLDLHLRGDVRTPRPRLATLADSASRQPIIVLLGMHRSGTSLCSNVLSILGVDMADDITPGKGNDRGHWERWEIVELHDRILGVFNRAYLGPFHDFPLPPGWWAEPRVTRIRQEIVSFLKGRMGDIPFGFKDPRTIRLLPMWRQIFSEMKLSPKFILCLRNPAQVARSLHERDGLDLTVGEYRWLVHMTDFFRYVGDNEFCVVEYENWFRSPSISLDTLNNHLNLDIGYSRAELDQTIIDIVDPELRHDNGTAQEASSPLVRHVYQLARSSGTDAAARAKLHDLTAQFISFDRLNRWFHREFESVSAVAAKLPGAEREIADLRTEAGQSAAAAEESLGQVRAELDAAAARLAELETERDAAAARSAAAAQEVAEARAEVEAARVRLAEIETERDAAIARAGQAEATSAEARAETEAAHARVAVIDIERDTIIARAVSAEQATVEAAAAAEALRVRLAEIEGRYDAAMARAATAERASCEFEGKYAVATSRAAVAEEMLAASRAEARDARARLGAVEAERAAAEQRLQHELTAEKALAEDRLAALEGARSAAAQAQKAEREFGAEVESLRRQVSVVSDELAAARHVNAAMLAALRDPPVPPLAAPRETWLTLLLRRVGLWRTSL